MAIFSCEALHCGKGLSIRDLKARLFLLGCRDFSRYLERQDLVRALQLLVSNSKCSGVSTAVSAHPSHASVSAESLEAVAEGLEVLGQVAAQDGSAVREVDLGSGFRLQVVEFKSAFDNSNTGALLWQSSIRLASYVVALGHPTFTGKHVIELGCGTGLAGIAAGTQGAHVILTDLEGVLVQTT